MGYFRNDAVARKELGLELFDGISLTDPNADRVMFWDDSAGGFAWLQAASGVTISGTTLQLDSNVRTHALYWIIDGGGAPLTTGVKGYLPVPFAATITQAQLVADQSGSIVVDVWKDTSANFPPTDADSITASAPITLSAAQNVTDATLTGWTTSLAAGDVLGFNVDSVSGLYRVTITLTATRT